MSDFRYLEWEKEVKEKNLLNLSENFINLEGLDLFPLSVESESLSLATFPKLIKTFIFNDLPVSQDQIDESLQEGVDLICLRDSNYFDFDQKKIPTSNVIDTSELHNCGARIIDEVKFIYEKLSLRDFNFDDDVVVLVSCDSQYFQNIAKIRAIRFILESIWSQYSLKNKFYIMGQSSLREQTIYDPWVNMLRNTTSSQAMILGGVDYITQLPFDYAFHINNKTMCSPTALRHARNSLSIELLESNLMSVVDSARGSYSIDTLTKKIIDQSLINFQSDEKADAKTTRIARSDQLKTRKVIMSGINDFVNTEEDLSLIYSTPVRDGFFDDCDPIFRYRTSFDFEKLRYKSPDLKVAVWIRGPMSKLSARSNFAKNFFEVLGHKVEEITTKDQISNFERIVICDLDDNYNNELADEIASLEKTFFIAGPDTKVEGVKESINIKTNIFDFLTNEVQEA